MGCNDDERTFDAPRRRSTRGVRTSPGRIVVKSLRDAIEITNADPLMDVAAENSPELYGSQGEKGPCHYAVAITSNGRIDLSKVDENKCWWYEEAPGHPARCGEMPRLFNREGENSMNLNLG